MQLTDGTRFSGSLHYLLAHPRFHMGIFERRCKCYNRNEVS